MGELGGIYNLGKKYLGYARDQGGGHGIRAWLCIPVGLVVFIIQNNAAVEVVLETYDSHRDHVPSMDVVQQVGTGTATKSP